MVRNDVALLVAFLVQFVDPAVAGSCRAAKLCCQGRDSGCVIQKESPNAIIESPRDKPCYCDHACLKLADCCDDFKETCGVVDCKVSEWTGWSACDAGCGSGTQRRNRRIETPERNGGKHCPKLDQIRSCRSFDECRSGVHSQPHDRSVTILSLFPADHNTTEDGNENEVAGASASCIAFTIVRASRACARVSSSLAEGSRICVKRHEEASAGDDSGSEEDEDASSNGAKLGSLVGIGRWRLSNSDGASPMPAVSRSGNTTCHGKWIGDSRVPIDCDDPRCAKTPGVPHVAEFSRRVRRGTGAIRRMAWPKNRRAPGKRKRRGKRRKRSKRRRRRGGEGDDEADGPDRS